MISLVTPPTHTPLRSNVTAARRVFFNVYHASFQHPPLAELGLTALVEAWRLAGLQGRCTRGDVYTTKGVRGRENKADTAEKLKQGCGETGFKPRSRFITNSLTAMLRNPEIRRRGGRGRTRRPSEGVRR